MLFFTLKYLKNNGYFLHYVDGSFSIWYAYVGTEFLEIKIALCGLRWFKLNVSKCQKDVKLSKKMSSCQKDVKCQKFKHLDYGGGSQKIKLTQ